MLAASRCLEATASLYIPSAVRVSHYSRCAGEARNGRISAENANLLSWVQHHRVRLESDSMSADGFRKGDLVEVRRPPEILATLDAHGMVDGLPFMPEMAAYCGRRFAVDRRADRMCDTIRYTGTRR